MTPQEELAEALEVSALKNARAISSSVLDRSQEFSVEYDFINDWWALYRFGKLLSFDGWNFVGQGKKTVGQFIGEEIDAYLEYLEEGPAGFEPATRVSKHD
jgi:hypothetical protein